jgi:hypothetical protein
MAEAALGRANSANSFILIGTFRHRRLEKVVRRCHMNANG